MIERELIMKKPLISLTIPAQAEYIDIVRLALYGVANQAGFSFEEIEDMKVAVSEACNNAVLHAYDNHQIGTIDITFKYERDFLCIHIKDSGDNFQIDQYKPKLESLHNKLLDDIVPGGLGMLMMHALMDSVELNTESGTEVILTKRTTIRNEEME